MTEHSHECRDCGAEIPCEGNGETCWDGGNSDCDDCDPIYTRNTLRAAYRAGYRAAMDEQRDRDRAWGMA